MNKEIKDRLDKLENELKESKDEIHSLKSSVSLKIERGIGKLFSRFTRKQIILGSLIVLFSISIIGIAGTVTKTYTFSSGETISASKFNTNFDTLYTLVNGNLDDNNISSLSSSKITKDGIFFYTSSYPGSSSHFPSTLGTSQTTGNIGGRTAADSICNNMKLALGEYQNSCSNVRALISFSSSDEVRDMPSNYSVPLDKQVFNDRGMLLSDNFTELISGNLLYTFLSGTEENYSRGQQISYWVGTTSAGALDSTNCNGWSTAADSVQGQIHLENYRYFGKTGSSTYYRDCDAQKPLLCLCY